MGQSWKLRLPCTKAEAEQLAGEIDILDDLESPPVLMTSEPDASRPDEWLLDAYVDAKPDDALVARIKALVPSATDAKPQIEALEDEDWVTLSQAGLEPITEGRFHVHTASHAAAPPPGGVSFLINAGRAFGTGQHATTAGCLNMIDRLASSGHHFRNMIDIGTGTGVLAFAALTAFGSRMLATDIDPVSIDVARENAEVNGVPVGIGPGNVEFLVADGLNERRLKARAPYDLIIANILAGPLIDMAADIAEATRPGGTIILAGLLDQQAQAVCAAYARHKCRLIERLERSEWPTLRLRKSSADL